MHFLIIGKKGNFLGHNPLSIFHQWDIKKLQQIQIFIFISKQILKNKMFWKKLYEGLYLVGLKIVPNLFDTVSKSCTIFISLRMVFIW